MAKYNTKEDLKGCDEKWLKWLKKVVDKELKRRLNAKK